MAEPNFAVEPFGVAVPAGPGWPTGPLVVHVPHAATEIPREVRRRLLLDDAALEAEVAALTDWHTDRLARDALDRAEVPGTVFRNRLSRLVIDPERFPDEREVMGSRGMGAVYTKTSQLEPLRSESGPEHDELLARYFRPYADALSELVVDVVDQFGRCVLVDVHSYPSVVLPYELDQTALRPGVCVGTDELHTPPFLRDAVIDAFAGVEGGVAIDTPFAGTYVPSRHVGIDTRVSSVMVEIRRDLYLDEPSAIDPVGFEDLVARLAGLFDTLDRSSGAS
jgi:N-formylglutamate amidohydrolase